MKILYGIQGTGNGHLTRSTCIIRQLQENGIHVDAIFSGCDENKNYDRSVINVIDFFKGFTFSVQNGSIQYVQTAKNISALRFIKDVSGLYIRDYDLIITDFEPVTAFAAKKNNIPSIGIGHQYAFLHDIPMDRSSRFSRMILKNFAPASYSLGMHWHHFGYPIIPPVIPGQIHSSETTDPRLILVYLPFENPDHIRYLLSPFKDYIFAVYSGNANFPKTNDKNIIWHPFSKTQFRKDLAFCKAVICNAGFELPSEAISLGKKLMVKPLKGQFEQVSNAIAVKQLELGTAVDQFDHDQIKRFFNTKTIKPKKFPDITKNIADWILKGNWSNTRELVRTVWQ